MAYTPTEWQNGDVITAEKLNKLEEGIENLSNSKLHTIFNDSITTSPLPNMNYSMGQSVLNYLVNTDKLFVTFKGIRYVLPKIESDAYGELDNQNMPVFTNYPCFIAIDNNTLLFATPEDGTYQIKIEIENLEDFFTINISKNGTEISIDKTHDEILNAINNQSIVFIKDGYKHIHVSNFSHENTMGGQHLYLNGLAWGYEQSANELVAISYTLVISPQSEANIHEKTIVLTTTSNN